MQLSRKRLPKAITNVLTSKFSYRGSGFGLTSDLESASSPRGGCSALDACSVLASLLTSYNSGVASSAFIKNMGR